MAGSQKTTKHEYDGCPACASVYASGTVLVKDLAREFPDFKSALAADKTGIGNLNELLFKLRNKDHLPESSEKTLGEAFSFLVSRLRVDEAAELLAPALRQVYEHDKDQAYDLVSRDNVRNLNRHLVLEITQKKHWIGHQFHKRELPGKLLNEIRKSLGIGPQDAFATLHQYDWSLTDSVHEYLEDALKKQTLTKTDATVLGHLLPHLITSLEPKKRGALASHIIRHLPEEAAGKLLAPLFDPSMLDIKILNETQGQLETMPYSLNADSYGKQVTIGYRAGELEVGHNGKNYKVMGSHLHLGHGGEFPTYQNKKAANARLYNKLPRVLRFGHAKAPLDDETVAEIHTVLSHVHDNDDGSLKHPLVLSTKIALSKNNTPNADFQKILDSYVLQIADMHAGKKYPEGIDPALLPQVTGNPVLEKAHGQAQKSAHQLYQTNLHPGVGGHVIVDNHGTLTTAPYRTEGIERVIFANFLDKKLEISREQFEVLSNLTHYSIRHMQPSFSRQLDMAHASRSGSALIHQSVD